MNIDLDGSYTCFLEVKESEIKHIGKILITDKGYELKDFVFLVSVDENHELYGKTDIDLAREYIESQLKDCNYEIKDPEFNFDHRFNFDYVNHLDSSSFTWQNCTKSECTHDLRGPSVSKFKNKSVERNFDDVIFFNEGDDVPEWLAIQKPHKDFHIKGVATFNQSCAVNKKSKEFYFFDKYTEIINFDGGLNMDIIINDDFIDIDSFDKKDNLLSMDDFKVNYMRDLK